VKFAFADHFIVNNGDGVGVPASSAGAEVKNEDDNNDGYDRDHEPATRVFAEKFQHKNHLKKITDLFDSN
jgi:hypothetical protein